MCLKTAVSYDNRGYAYYNLKDYQSAQSTLIFKGYTENQNLTFSIQNYEIV
jgi:hypothetical protein